jgi:hypothetical protein
VAGGGECEALAKVADRLCEEFGYRVDDLPTDVLALQDDRGMLAAPLSLEDERLVKAGRRCLVKISLALRTRTPGYLPQWLLEALLDGAEGVMRSELAKGRRLSTIMPDAVFLIAITAVDRDEALELSERTASLLEEFMG